MEKTIFSVDPKGVNLEILCLILARGGSERVPGKNIRLLAGKPLIYYTIAAAKKSKYISRIIVSTDDTKIASVAKKLGADVPFRRPKEISQSDSKEIDAFKHALKWLKENENYEPDLIVKLFPTSPFRSVASIDSAINLMIKNKEKVDSLRSVRLCKEHPYKMWQINNNRLLPFVPWNKRPKDSHTFSYQLLPKIYVNNASIDVTKPLTIWKKNSITGKKIIPFVMNDFESLDINHELDFIMARLIMKNISYKKLLQR